MSFDLIKNLEIDSLALDKAAQGQPEMIRKYGKLYSRARNETLRWKRKLEVAEVEAAESIKNDPDKYDVSVNRQGSVSDTVAFKLAKGTEEYKKVFEMFLTAKQKEEDLGILMDALKDRGYMIKQLVDLWLNNYYSEVSVMETSRRRSKRKRLKPLNNDQ